MLRSLVRRHAIPPSTQLRRILFSICTSASSSGATASPDPHFMVEYLVNTCGFSADDASKVSKLLPRIQSTEKADVVLGFFRSQGLDGANLRRLITWKPGLLGWDVETNLAPKFKLLRDMGLSESDVIDVVRLHPVVIGFNSQNTLLPPIEDLGKFIWIEGDPPQESPEEWMVFSSSIENVVRPNINFLRDECGIPEERISLVLKRHPGLFAQKPDSLRALADRVEGIGITRESGMFLSILDVLHKVSREKFAAHVKLMNNFGWSNSDFVAAIKKQPTFLWLSTEGLQRKMEFLVKDVGLAPLYIAKQSVFLRLSLEKRLIPRFLVMEKLKSEGLWTSQDKLYTIFSSPGPKFLQKYVLPYKDKLPKLFEVL